MDGRTFTGYIVLNWRNGDQRLVKKKPSKFNPYEVLSKYHIVVEVPDTSEVLLDQKITVPEAKIKEAVAREI